MATGLWFAVLGIAFAVVGLVLLADVRMAAFFFALSLVFFRPLARFLREDPHKERGYRSGTSDIWKDWRVRAEIAGEPKTPTDVLERLARDPMTAVRFAVAGNPSTPLPALKRLMNDGNREVRKEAEAGHG